MEPDLDVETVVRRLRQISRNEEYKACVLQTPVLRKALFLAASRFIGGEVLPECLGIARGFHARGIATAVDHMGESTRDRERAALVTREFLRVMEAFADLGRMASISPDLSHLGMAIDPELAFTNAKTLADAAMQVGCEVMLNMEGSDRTETILAIHRRLCERYDNVGVTLQAYLYRTEKDLTDAIGRPGRIRLVKGAYAEPPDVARPLGPATDAAFSELMGTLLESEHPSSIATHDAALLDKAHGLITDRGLGKDPIEFELNYGISEDRLLRMDQLGYRVRVYLPYGEEWYLYLCHRVAEYPRNIYQAVADALTGLPA